MKLLIVPVRLHAPSTLTSFCSMIVPHDRSRCSQFNHHSQHRTTLALYSYCLCSPAALRRYKRFKKWAEKHAIGAKPSRPSSSPPSSSPSLAPLSNSSGVGSTLKIPSSSPAMLPLPSSSTSQFSTSPRKQQQHLIGGASVRMPAPTSPPVPPAWLFPSTVPHGARALLVSLLVPNPSRRMSVEQAMSHPWLAGGWPGDRAGNGGAPGQAAVSNEPVSTGAVLNGGTVLSGVSSGVSGDASSGVPGGGRRALPPGGLVADQAFLSRRGGQVSTGAGSSTVSTASMISSVAQQMSVTAIDEAGVVSPSRLAAPPAPPPGEQSNVRGDSVVGRREGGRAGEGREGGEEEEAGRMRARAAKEKESNAWRRWRVDMSPEDILSCRSVPSTTSFP